ncbi:MAG: hypothetical protein AB2826_19685 [Candidatus Thiodiazotropha sp.]
METVLVFILMIMLEAVVITGFLLNAHLAASPDDAILFALLISGTNVFFCAWVALHIGRWTQYGAHAADSDNPEFVAIRRRARGLFWLCMLVVGLFHSTSGLVIVQGTLEELRPSLMAYLGILTNPHALYMVMTGVGMSVLAYQKSKKIADSYPYFSEYHRAKVAAYEAFQAAYAGYVAEIEDRHAATRQALDRAWKEYRKEEVKVEKLLSRCLEARRELFRAVDEAESALHTDIARLDETHQAARSDNKPLPDAALNQLASYQDFLEDTAPPALDVPPNFQDYRKPMDETKASALYELRGLFENLHDTYGDHTS